MKLVTQMWLVVQLKGKMQYLEHINITSSQEETDKKKIKQIK
jgi:hypothetical protein